MLEVIGRCSLCDGDVAAGHCQSCEATIAPPVIEIVPRPLTPEEEAQNRSDNEASFRRFLRDQKIEKRVYVVGWCILGGTAASAVLFCALNHYYGWGLQ